MSTWKGAFVRYFEEGIKNTEEAMLGVEVEHFILDRDNCAVPYETERGIRRVLEDLILKCPGAEKIIEEDFLGFVTPDFSITLEPAAQLEISIRTSSDIEEISEIYRDFREKLDHVLAPYGYHAAVSGCQPVSSVKDLKMIPKKRYKLMNDYFEKLGSGGMEMMRGTASLQVSIDYRSEMDFRRKMQAAYYYSPVLMLLNDNSPVFQNEKMENRLKRTDIWRRVDDNRCRLAPRTFAADFSFSDYADFIGEMKPVFLKDKDGLISTGDKTVEELYADREPDEEQIAHILSMTFPGVRLKHFLEIRFADAVPLPLIKAYCALIKGLLYAEEGLRYAETKCRDLAISEEIIHRAEDEIIAKGWDAVVYGQPVREMAEKMLEIAGSSLTGAEKEYLKEYHF